MINIVRLSEKELKKIIIETTSAVLLNENFNRHLLIENFSRTKWGKMAMKYLRYEQNMPKEKAEEFIDATCHDLEIHHANDPRFAYILGCVRLTSTEVRNEQDISMLKTILKYIASEGHQGDYDSNLNGESIRTLYNRFKPLAIQDAEKSRNSVNSMQYQNKGYNIVKIDTDEQARQYGKYTDWCITRGSFDDYSLNTFNQCYFCLKNGFENIPRNVGENCPLDEYGLSMVSVIVDENGEPKYITTRWNHANNGENNPNFRTAEQVSNILGVNFYETFKPSNKWKEIVDNALERLKNGERPIDIFDNCYKFRESFAVVELSGKCNFINTDGEIISNQWFDDCYNFSESFAVVELNKKCNFINTDGEIISDQWFDYCDNFSEGFAMVMLSGKYNFINTNGEFISNQWFDDCYKFREGFAKVELNGKYNFINTNGEIISDQWFDFCCESFSESFAVVELNKKYNFINTNGEIISDQWFDVCYNFIGGFAKVKLNGKYNFINTDGKIISDQWFNSCYGFIEGFAKVTLNNQLYKIDARGNLYDIDAISESIKKNLRNALLRLL